MLLFLPVTSYAAKGDYEVLVERNLELREKLDTLEQKYAQLENERSVLIGHVRNLQQEKEKLPPPRGEPLAEGSLPGNASQGVPTSAPRDAQLQAALDQMNEKLGFATQERDQLQKELDEIGEENDAKIKTLESENAAFVKQVEGIGEKLKLVSDEKYQLEKEMAETEKMRDQRQTAVKALESEMDALSRQNEEINEEIKSVLAERTQSRAESIDLRKMLETSQTAVKALESQNAALNKQIEEIREKSRKDQSIQKNLAVDLAFARAKEAELTARHQTVLAGSDRLKADVQRLTRANEALKDAEQKWQQAKRDLDAARTGSRKAEVKNKKLENKLAKMKVLETRSREKEEELKALRMLEKEHEAMIGKLSSEKSTLDARLAKLATPAGAASAASARKKGVLSPANKQRIDMHFNLAVAYDKTKMYKAEEREYLECLRIDSSDANVHYNLGILYDDKLNDNAKAIKHYRRFLQLRPLGEDSEQVKEWIMHAEQQQRL